MAANSAVEAILIEIERLPLQELQLRGQDLLAGVVNVALDQRALIEEIGAAIRQKLAATGFTFNSNGSSKPAKDGRQTYYYYCSHQGRGVSKSKGLRQRGSAKVGCTAKFTITNTGRVDFDLQHSDDCIRITLERPVITNLLAQIDLAKPGTIARLEELLVQRLDSDCGGTAPRDLKKTLEQFFRNERIDPSLASIIPLNIEPSFATSLVRRAYMRFCDNISHEESLEKLGELLKNDGEPYKLYKVNHMTSTGRVPQLQGIHFHIKELEPPLPHDLAFSVLMADVTFNYSNARSGFKKMSMVCSISPSRLVHPLVTSLIMRENYDTFCHELEFLADLYPRLKEVPFVFIVDGDRGRIKAIRKVFPLVSIYLCLWHKGIRVKDRIRLASARAHRAPVKVDDVSVSRDTAQNPVLNEEMGSGEDDDEDNLDGDEDDRMMEAFLEASLDTEEEEGESAVPNPSSGSAPTTLPSTAEEVDSSETAVPLTEIDSDPFPVDRFNDGTADRVFRWLHRASSHSDALARIALLKCRFPELAPYCDRELVPTIDLWAGFFRTWKLSFNLSSSTMQENLFSSLKRYANHRPAPPHKLPELLKRTMQGRQFNAMSRRERGLLQLESWLKSASFTALVDLCSTHLTTEGRIAILDEFTRSQGYAVTRLQPDQPLETYFAKLRRGPSGNRFTLLFPLGVVPEDRLGQVFAVTHNTGEYPSDLVAISAAGSFACTCGDFATTGAPCRHALALVRFGHAGFNVFHHVHPVYRSTLSHHKANEFTFKLPVAEQVPAIASAANWDELVKRTEREWVRTAFVAGAISSASSALIPSPTKRHANDTEDKSVREKVDEIIRLARDLCGKREELWEELLRLNEGFVQKHSFKRQAVLDDEVVVMPAALSTGRKRRNLMSADYQHPRAASSRAKQAVPAVASSGHSRNAVQASPGKSRAAANPKRGRKKSG